MSSNFKNRPPRQHVPEAERRRTGKVVHDDRGNASWSYRDAPPGEERAVLEVLGGDPQMSVKNEETYDPYSRPRARQSGGMTSRTDLRKLGEWIKMMRELEERKSRGEDGDT